MRIVGLSAFCHDSAVALVENGQVVAAAQEERFNRQRHHAGFPAQALAACLAQAGWSMDQVDGLAVLDVAGQQDACRLAVANLWPHLTPVFVDHGLAHGAAAFYPSPHDRAAILVIDDPHTADPTRWGLGQGGRMDLSHGHDQSLGRFYSAITDYLGFKTQSGEYKVMGLAPYGVPRFVPLLRDHLIDLRDDGLFSLAADLGRDRLAALFGQPARRADVDDLTPFHMDVAASLQAVVNQAILALAGRVRRDCPADALCLAGSVALNCVANGHLARSGLFRHLWIQPAAGEAGGALGAALALYHGHHRRVVCPGDGMQGALLGPSQSQAEITDQLTRAGAVFQTLDDDALYARTARALADGWAVGWVQGRMEFGPRALGARSILADPRHPAMQSVLNHKVKFRESFRPFAPAVLAEDAAHWFELEQTSPYMLLVAPLRQAHRLSVQDDDLYQPANDLPGCISPCRAGASAPLAAPVMGAGYRPTRQVKGWPVFFGISRLQTTRSALPAITHVDFSARVQTVAAADNPRFHAVLTAFKSLTGCGVLVNTSFNIRGEPMVCTAQDAFRCFMGSGLDGLAVGNCWLEKSRQPSHLQMDYRATVPRD